MTYYGNDNKLFKTQNNFYQAVTSPYLKIDMNIQDGGMHNDCFQQSVIFCISEMILKIC